MNRDAQVRSPVLPNNLGGELQRAFLKFHNAHPQVWTAFVRFTFQAMERFQHYSADAICHQIRWTTNFGDTSPTREFKIANAHVAFYARVWRDTYPEHAEFFRFQKREAA